MPRKPSTAKRPAREPAAVGKLRAQLARLEAANAQLRAQLEAAKFKNPPPAPAPHALKQLGPPPENPLEGNAWAHRAMMISLHNAATDDEISERERRREMRTIAASAAKLTPTAAIYEATRLINEDRAELSAKTAARRRAQLEQLPPRDNAGNPTEPS